MVCHFSFIAHNIEKADSHGNRRGLRVLILSKVQITVKNISERKGGERWGPLKKKRNGGTDEKPNMRHSQKRRPLVM